MLSTPCDHAGGTPNALGVKRRLAATETRIDTPPPTARCRFNSLLDGPHTDAACPTLPSAHYGVYKKSPPRHPACGAVYSPVRNTGGRGPRAPRQPWPPPPNPTELEPRTPHPLPAVPGSVALMPPIRQAARAVEHLHAG